MADYLAIIQRIIQEHQAIRLNLKRAGDSLSDRESLSALEKASSGWVPARTDMLQDKLTSLRQTLNTLAVGLEKHFQYEEIYLPPIIGEFLMRALLLDHARIREEIAHAREVIEGTATKGLSQEQILTAELHIQETVTGVFHIIEEHAFGEEVLLKMAERGLEAKQFYWRRKWTR